MGSANRTRVTIKKMTSFAQVAADPLTAAKTLTHITSQSIDPQYQYVQSRKLRSDRQIADDVLTGFSVQGALPGECNFASSGSGLRDLWVAALGASAETTVSDVTGCTIAGSNSNITKTAGWAAVQIGDMVRVSGSSATADNGYYRVTAKPDADNITVDTGSESFDAGGSSVTVEIGDRLLNSTTLTHFFAEIAHLDVDVYRFTNALTLSGFSLAIQDQELTTLEFRFLGRDFATRGTTYVSSPTADTANPTYDCKGDVPAIKLDGDTLEVKGLTLQGEFSPRANTIVGTLAATAIPDGSFNITGTIDAYLRDTTLLEQIAADTTFVLTFALVDASGQAMVFSLPRVKLLSAAAPAEGLDTDVMQRFTFSARLNPGSDDANSMRIHFIT